MTDYVKNATWADGSGGGTPINAAKLNNIENGIFDAHYQPAVRAYNSINLAIVTATYTALTFDSERFDQSSNVASTMHSTSSNTGRLTCLHAGVYQISASVRWDNFSTGNYRIVQLRVNGASVVDSSTVTPVAAVNTDQSLTTNVLMAVNDYVEVMVQHDRGSNLNVLAATLFSPEFSMVRVA